MSEPRDEIRIEKIPTVPGMGRAFIEHDPKSRNFPVMGALVKQGVIRRTKTWRRAHTAYDQGQTSTCVGQTFRGVLNTGPLTAAIPLETRRKYTAKLIYDNAQEWDQWPGEEPAYFGTSALGALRWLASVGVVKEYRWCFGLDDVLDTLSAYGPVGIGVWWHEGMMNTNTSGYIKPTGQKIGGHEVELHGIDLYNKCVIGTNSWGTGWGINGRFKIKWTDLDLLLQDDGDAATVVK